MKSKKSCLTIVAIVAVTVSAGVVDTAYAHGFVPQSSSFDLERSAAYLTGHKSTFAGGPHLSGRNASTTGWPESSYLDGQSVSSPDSTGAPSLKGRGVTDAAPPRGGAGGSVVAEASRWIGSRNMTGMVGPWCADAVSFWLRRTGHRPLANRSVSSAFRYGQRLAGPQVGAIAVISTRRGWAGHVGIVASVEPDGSIRMISGNWSHRVRETVVSRRSVVAFVRVD